MLDYIIKGGTIVDGTGQAPYDGDIGIQDGKLVEVGGSITTRSKEVIDAHGAIVTPGFIDVHTHYDGQVTWDDAIEPSASHGVTTVVMGNCGVGFAPVRPGGEKGLIELMEGVEDIPGTALYEGMPWGEWETYPEYLDFLSTQKYALDVGSQIPHGALRTYVMGDRGEHNEAATDADIEQMANLIEEGMRAGALGFSTSRILGHTSLSGEPVPGTYAEERELLGLAEAMSRAGFGVIENVPAGAVGSMSHIGPDHRTSQQEIDLMSKLSKMTGRPVTFSLFQLAEAPDAWRDAMTRTEQANLAGAKLFPQVSVRPPGVLISFSAHHPFLRRETFLKIQDLPHDQLIAELRKPEIRAAILADADIPPGAGAAMPGLYLFLSERIRNFYALGTPLDYEPDPSKSIGAIADKLGLEPEEVLYDELLKQDGYSFLMLMQTNYCEGNHDVIREMLMNPASVAGLGDGGAHVKLICDGSMQTYAIKHWTKDRHRGEKMALETIVNKLTMQNTALYGMRDRGRLTPGLRADVNVIDLNTIGLHRPHLVNDLPGGFSRLLQSADGYRATLVNGCITRRFDQDTGNRPGRLVRGSAN